MENHCLNYQLSIINYVSAISMKKETIIGILVILLGTVAACRKARVDDTLPNIIVILADDLGYGDLSCYGATRWQTPHIDRLAQEGILFDNYHSASTVCSPTRAALLSGRTPYSIGMPGVVRSDTADSWGYLFPDVPLLPAYLKNKGYQTALIGKWHLGLAAPNLPGLKGFDYFAGFLSDKVDDYYTHLRGNVNYLRLNELTVQPKGHLTDIYVNWALDYINRIATPEKPFFMYWAHNAPHNPVQPPPDFVESYRKKHPEQQDTVVIKYGAFIEHLDDAIGRVLDGMNAARFGRPTLVVFTSDNGGNLSVGAYNKWRSGKGTFYEGGLRVPCIVAGLPDQKGKIVRNDLITTIDIVPTILELVNYPNRETLAMDGSSFLPVLRNSQAGDMGKNRALFWYWLEGGDKFGSGNTIEAWREGNYMLLKPEPNAKYELYDLVKDSLQRNNLADIDTERYNSMKAAIEMQIKAAKQVPFRKP